MAEFKYSVFYGQSIPVDGENYDTCCFRNCTLVYEGGEPPVFSNCSFVDCTWLLGRVKVTEIGFMAVCVVREADELIDQLLDAIRHRRLPTEQAVLDEPRTLYTTG